MKISDFYIIEDKVSDAFSEDFLKEDSQTAFGTSLTVPGFMSQPADVARIANVLSFMTGIESRDLLNKYPVFFHNLVDDGAERSVAE